MTIYAVTNPNAVPLRVHHLITGPAGFRYAFDSTIPPRSTAEYHLRDMDRVPHPFAGTVTLTADKPFTAQIVGYDRP
jgi:hypothetical protein